MGELSPFFVAFGIFAAGVSPETSKLPEGWRDRLVKVQKENTNGAIGWLRVALGALTLVIHAISVAAS